VKIINVHAHIWENEDVDKRIAHYSCPGMARICVIGRDKARAALEKYPELVIGLGIVFPGEDAPSIIDRYRSEGFAGAKFIAPRAPYDSEEYFPFYEKLVEHGMVATFHTGYVSDFGKDTSILWMHPMTLDRIARRFPALKVIGYHIGNPWYTEACAMALNFPNVYWDLSGGTVRATPLSYLRHVFSFRTLSDVGEGVLEHQLFNEDVNIGLFRKFCFGTDNPAPVYMMDFMADLMTALNVPADVQELVWWRNAARLFGIEKEIEALPG
jgi:predicted TIM-barrel fold metal-dependent hydrolase